MKVLKNIKMVFSFVKCICVKTRYTSGLTIAPNAIINGGKSISFGSAHISSHTTINCNLILGVFILYTEWCSCGNPYIWMEKNWINTYYIETDSTPELYKMISLNIPENEYSEIYPYYMDLAFRVYLDLDVIPQTKYFMWSDWHESISPQIKQEIIEWRHSNKPKYLISPLAIYNNPKYNDNEFIREYKLVDKNNNHVLMIRK